jgi:hypothetical protein
MNKNVYDWIDWDNPHENGVQLKDNAPEEIKRKYEEYWEKRRKYNLQWKLALWLNHEVSDGVETISLKEGAPEEMKKAYEELKKRLPDYHLLRKVIML